MQYNAIQIQIQYKFEAGIYMQRHGNTKAFNHIDDYDGDIGG